MFFMATKADTIFLQPTYRQTGQLRTSVALSPYGHLQSCGCVSTSVIFHSMFRITYHDHNWVVLSVPSPAPMAHSKYRFLNKQHLVCTRRKPSSSISYLTCRFWFEKDKARLLLY